MTQKLVLVTGGKTGTGAAIRTVFKTDVISRLPAGRLAQPEEMARADTFLAADESGLVTGQMPSLNGGHYM